MKIENVIVALIAVLTIVVGYFTYRYNTVSEAKTTQFDAVIQQELASYQEEKKAKKRNYLETLETYEDADVAVDPTKEAHKNVVKVQAEEKTNAIERSVASDTKHAYTEQLEHYDEGSENTAVEKQTDASKTEDDKTRNTEEGNGDTIAADIDAIIGE